MPEEIASHNPATGEELGRVQLATVEDYEQVVGNALEAFLKWRTVPAPKRGEIVREIGNALRESKEELGKLVTQEMGKIFAEGRGEVQEMIDIADFAVGLSRQLYGLSMHSERPGHRMYEQWQPLGIVGVISAFNFPVAVWSWNALIALVCGDVVIWKPSLKTPLTALAVQTICDPVLEKHGHKGILNLIIGRDETIGSRLINDFRIPLISATGSTRMGHIVSKAVSERLGRSLLELGGNNGVIVMDDADPELVVRAVLFGAVGTAGQRCTTIRRLFLQRNIAPKITERLIAAYKHIPIGDPMDPKTLMGPLIDSDAVDHMMHALDRIREQGGKILYGGRRLHGCFVEPTIVQSTPGKPMVIVIFSTACDDCVKMIHMLDDVQKEYGPLGLKVIGVAGDENARYLLQGFIARYRPTFPIGFLTKDEIIKLADVDKGVRPVAPILLFVDQWGFVREQFYGDHPMMKDAGRSLKPLSLAMIKIAPLPGAGVAAQSKAKQ